MEVLFTYNVGLSSVSIIRDAEGAYHYVVSDIDTDKHEAVAKHISKALETLGSTGRVSVYDVTKAILDHLKGYDPELIAYVVSRELKFKKLQVLLDDPYVEDISIVGPGPVWVRHRLVLEKDPRVDYIETNILLESHEEFINYMELIAERCGKVINKRTPIMDFTLPEEDGGHRVHIVLPDVAHGAGEIVIRKKSPGNFVSLESLVEAGMMPEAVAELIKVIVRKGGSILILGPPGSGKTTLLKAILYSTIPRFWKIAIIEDVPEVDVPKGTSWTRYVVPTDVWGAERGVDQMILAKAALRASVSRFIVIGETRGAEARVLAQAMNMGLGGLCLPADQLLLARVDGDVGLYEIGELVEGFLEGRHKAIEVATLGPNYSPTWARISSVVVKSGSSNFVRVEVEGGAMHEVHEDHPVVVVTDGKLDVKRAGDLIPGEFLAALQHPPEIGREDPCSEILGMLTLEPKYAGSKHELLESLGYIAGAYVTCGKLVRSSAGSFVGVHLDVDESMTPKLLRSLEDVGVDHSDLKTLEKGLFVESMRLAKLLFRLLGDESSKEDFLSVALGSCTPFRAGLARGLWSSLNRAYGGTTSRVCVCSRRMAESLTLLLKTLGILASVSACDEDHSSSSKCYEVSVESFGRGRNSSELLEELDHRRKMVGGLQLLRVRRVEVIKKNSLLYDIEVPGTHLYAISGSLVLTHNTTFHAGSPEEAIVRLTSPPIELTPHQLSMIWLFITLGFRENGGLRRVVVRVDEPILASSTLALNTIYRYGEKVDLETLLRRMSRARELWP